ncbi:MAG: DUF2330 domain-containing protein [Bacteroidia bacterium]|nr:DUF2330 domain-containing protein [Bacteroidia bacterium]
MKKILISLLLLSLLASESFAFCGFYVAKAGAKLFNKSSQVILVRDGNRSVITMSNDFKGDVKDFAMVVPVPEVLKRDQIRIAEASLFDRFDAYSGPRLAEYYDENPCHPPQPVKYSRSMSGINRKSSMIPMPTSVENKDYGVKIKAEYDVEEYKILILSATHSSGLEAWLTDNGYKIPSGAQEVLEPYIKNNMKFFVVKVDLSKVEQTGPFTNLRPLQIEFNSPKFMLPIRLGMANAEDSQDLIVYALSKKGRIETVNYRTISMPTDREIPLFVKTEGTFEPFYKDLFDRSYKQAGRQGVFLEYAWDASLTQPVKCDPCVGPPPMITDFQQAGADWVSWNSNEQSGKAFFTRLHVRYDRANFPQDLIFQETPNQKNFQCRYVIHNPPYDRTFDCAAGQTYLRKLQKRRQDEMAQLAILTGWNTWSHREYLEEFSGQIKEETGSLEKNGLGWMIIAGAGLMALWGLVRRFR